MRAMRTKATLSQPFCLEGVAVHHGTRTQVQVFPAQDGGIVFLRRGVEIPAHIACVSQAAYGVTLTHRGESVGVVEHLLAALAMRGITEARVDVAGPELPILDGSALPFAEILEAQGIDRLPQPLADLELSRPVEVTQEARRVSALAGERLHVSARIDYPHPAIGVQHWEGELTWDVFLREIAPARTFGFLKDREHLTALGKAAGASLDNALVFDDHGPLSGNLRFADEPVRHKVLDLLGDLALLGRPLRARVLSDCGGHELNTRLVRLLEAQTRNNPG